ncbi:hypothetical protein TNIN_325221 [Trichonephila inaurata madagascariensis]|uniref:Uncharacterized protein n=1 Tax=Trichonephila inaurata madagascariensis TaxID=2747483 RepID=A0A8X6XV55_9ARAC|nr:hypothetical protein TNIN_325221 [Trichonephila inaurata madagascariensis]
MEWAPGAKNLLDFQKMLKPHNFIRMRRCGKKPLEESLICLSLAEVVLDCGKNKRVLSFGDSPDQEKFYLLGNKTAALLEDYKTKKRCANGYDKCRAN